MTRSDTDDDLPVVYLDHNATTPLRRTALRAMLPHLRSVTGNPSSTHQSGVLARAALDRARSSLAALLGASADELVFTSGGTEANNLALGGVTQPLASGDILTSAIEHPSVLQPARALQEREFGLTLVNPACDGALRAEEVIGKMDDATVLVSLQWANHETGVIQPIEQIAEALTGHRVVFHVDAVQAFGKIPIELGNSAIDLLSISAHKIGGPPGIGALYIRQGLPLEPLLRGGSQEDGRRPGTPPVALAVGFAAAAEELVRRREESQIHLGQLRERLLRELPAIHPQHQVNGYGAHCLAGTVSVAFPGVDRESLLINLDLSGIRISAGAACESGSIAPSPVLQAMIDDPEIASSSVRISMGLDTSEQHIERLVSALHRAVPRARNAHRGT